MNEDDFPTDPDPAFTTPVKRRTPSPVRAAAIAMPVPLLAAKLATGTQDSALSKWTSTFVDGDMEVGLLPMRPA